MDWSVSASGETGLGLILMLYTLRMVAQGDRDVCVIGEWRVFVTGAFVGFFIKLPLMHGV